MQQYPQQQPAPQMRLAQLITGVRSRIRRFIFGGIAGLFIGMIFMLMLCASSSEGVQNAAQAVFMMGLITGFVTGLISLFSWRYYVLCVVIFIVSIPCAIIGGVVESSVKNTVLDSVGWLVYLILTIILSIFGWRWMKRRVFGELLAAQPAYYQPPAAIPAPGHIGHVSEETTRFGRRGEYPAPTAPYAAPGAAQYCQHCGRALTPGTMFCNYCGKEQRR